MMKPSNNIFVGLSPDNSRLVRAKVLRLVMATRSVKDFVWLLRDL